MTPILGMLSVVLGLLIGAFGTFIGAGGGFLLVPVLLLAYHFAPADAVGTSLALVFLNAFSGSVAYLRQGRVDIALGWKFAAATIPGAVGGAYLTRAGSRHTLSAWRSESCSWRSPLSSSPGSRPHPRDVRAATRSRMPPVRRTPTR